MRLSVDLGNVRKKLGLYPAIELIAAAGFDALDFSFCGFEDAPELADDGYLEEAKRIRAFLDQNHIACNQAHAPFKLTCDDRYDLSEKSLPKSFAPWRSPRYWGRRGSLFTPSKCRLSV